MQLCVVALTHPTCILVHEDEISILVLHSYQQWGVVGETVFGFKLFGEPWTEWFTEIAIWLAVALTFISGWLYLRRNRAIYLQDL